MLEGESREPSGDFLLYNSVPAVDALYDSVTFFIYKIVASL